MPTEFSFHITDSKEFEFKVKYVQYVLNVEL